MKTWFVFLIVCLNATACFHGIDGTKVKCTSSDHCPNNFVCAGGMCVSGSSSTDARSTEAGPVAAVDSAGADSQSVGPDEVGARLDGAPSGSDVDATPDASADLLSETDVPLLVTGGAGGGPGSTGGTPGSGGVTGSAGVSTTGGVVSSGGTVSTGGVPTTGGISGTCGTTCQPKPRDCTSALDNDCNGTPDKQETTFCTCSVGQARPCQEHPGYDGTGICKAGSQTCAASADKTTSSWGACSGAVGPGTRDCTSSADNDCNGTPDSQETSYCVCSAGKTQSCQPASACTAGSQTCAASSDKATTAWGPCTGYTGPTTQYRDYDGDGYGNPAQSAQVCPGTAGYVSNADDCDDANSAFKPGVSICSTVTQRKTCTSGGGGTASVETCDQGCINGNCRTDGTIGLPGYVSCTPTHTPRCLAADGCNVYDGTCGATTSFVIYCDGPNDCPSGQQCWFTTIRGFTESKCYATPPDNNYSLVCDPLASACTPPLVCTALGDPWYFYHCQ